MKKKWLPYSLLFLLAVPSVLADLTSSLGNVWDKVIGVGNLSFLGVSDSSLVAAFTRILIGFLVFTILFALASYVGGREGSLGFLNKKQGGIISAIIAIITAIFIPASVLLAIGVGWATAISLLLIGGPIVGLILLLWKIPGENKPETKGTILLKLVICLVLFWILSAMKYHVGRMA